MDVHLFATQIILFGTLLCGVILLFSGVTASGYLNSHLRFDDRTRNAIKKLSPVLFLGISTSLLSSLFGFISKKTNSDEFAYLGVGSLFLALLSLAVLAYSALKESS